MILRVRCKRVGEACKGVKLSTSAWIFRLVSFSLSFSDRFLRGGEMLWRNLEGESLSEKVFAENSAVMSESLFRKALTFEIRPHAGNHRQTLSLRFLVCSSFASQKMGTSVSFHWCEKKKKKKKIAEDQVFGSGLCREVCVLGRRSSVHHSPSTWLHRRPGQGKDAIQAPRSPADWTASFREPTAIGPLRYQLRCKTTKRAATNRNRSLLVGWLFPGKFLRTRK